MKSDQEYLQEYKAKIESLNAYDNTLNELKEVVIDIIRSIQRNNIAQTKSDTLDKQLKSATDGITNAHYGINDKNSVEFNYCKEYCLEYINMAIRYSQH